MENRDAVFHLFAAIEESIRFPKRKVGMPTMPR
jgi:hypothetical protein